MTLKNSKRKSWKFFVVIFLLGLFYFIWIRLSGPAIPCLFRSLTGWQCPGCGITTMILCLADLDFRGAYQANPFLFITGPFLITELFYYMYLYHCDRKLPGWNHIMVTVYAAALIIFGIGRNFFS